MRPATTDTRSPNRLTIQLTKKIWDHIKKHKLQDAKNRRMINADDALKAIFGGKKQVSMFEMTKLVSKHIKG